MRVSEERSGWPEQRSGLSEVITTLYLGNVIESAAERIGGEKMKYLWMMK